MQWQKTNQAGTRHRGPLQFPRSLVVCLHMKNAQTATEREPERETATE